MNDKGIEELCNAIILSAVKDYRDALAKNNEFQVASLERFFHSEWYSTLTNVDGDYLIEQIRQEFAQKR